MTTLDRRIARVMEPRAAAPHRRIEVIRRLSDAGVPVAVMTAPIIPALTDGEMEAMLKEAADAGATHAGYVMLRMPLEIKDLFREWLQAHFPNRATRVLSLIREMRGGKDYDATFHTRGKGEGPYAQMVATRFEIACRRLGLNKERKPLDHTQFRRPIDVGGHPDLFEQDTTTPLPR